MYSDLIDLKSQKGQLPRDVGNCAVLRGRLLHYLLDPVLALRAIDLKREVRDLESDDVYDRVFESFRDALGLYDPAELWSTPARLSPAERADNLRHRVVVAGYKNGLTAVS